MASYSDLNILHAEKKTFLLQTLNKAAKLGYDLVAVNHIVPELDMPKKKQKERILIPDPKSLKVCENELKDIQKWRRPLHMCSRLSAFLVDGCYLHKLSDPTVQAYDIIAVQPATEKTFHQACTNLDVDIITVDVTKKLPFFIRRNPVNAAIERGIHFEIQYAPALKDSFLRRVTISNAIMLIETCKGKNVILSSGCEKAIELRGPLDVANMGLLFGMTQGQCKDSVTKNCKAVLSHAEARKLKGSAIQIQRASTLPQGDKWLLENCKPDFESSTLQNGQVIESTCEEDEETNSDCKHTTNVSFQTEQKNISASNCDHEKNVKKIPDSGNKVGGEEKCVPVETEQTTKLELDEDNTKDAMVLDNEIDNNKSSTSLTANEPPHKKLKLEGT